MDDRDIKIALLERDVETMRKELADLVVEHNQIQSTIKTGKGIIIGVLFVLGSTGIALAQGIKTWLKIG